MFYKIIKAHLFYLLSKRNIILIVVLNLSTFLYLLIESNIFDRSLVDANRMTYLSIYRENSFAFIKIFYAFFVNFASSSYFFGPFSSYGRHFVRDKKTRNYFFITKIIAIILFITIEFVILYLLYEVIKIITPYGLKPFVDFKEYIKIYKIGIYLLFLSFLVLNTIKTTLSSIIPIIVFWISDMIIDYSSKLSIIGLIISSITLSSKLDIDNPFGAIHSYLVLFLFLIINVFVTFKTDLV